MASTAVRFGIIGVGGFAHHHLEALLRLEKDGLVSIQAVADPSDELVRTSFTTRGRSVRPAFVDYRQMLASAKLDAVCIATPLHLHCEMAVAALRSGCAVFMEKPPVVSLDQWNEVMKAIRDTGLPCGIDFQMMSGQIVADFKRWIVDGRLGDIKSVVAFSHQRRYDAYYERARWAGKISLDGRPVRDGSVNNPMAHQLNLALHLASRSPFEWAQPKAVRAELYRAHPIETEDTTCSEIATSDGPTIYFYTTLCSKHYANRTAWRVFGTEAQAEWEDNTLRLLRNGRVLDTITFGDEHYGSVSAMVENMALFLRGKADRLLCPFQKTRAFVAAVEGMFQSSRVVHPVPSEFVRRFPIEDSTATEITEIDEHLQAAAQKQALLSDLKVPWAVPTTPFTLPAA
jgi:predicted dehydrogenase